jgi:hypothetical protein
MGWRGRVRYPPIRTVNSPNTITPPCAVMSVIRAAGKPQTKTVKDPKTITSGGPAHVNMSEMRACGSPPVSTVTAQGGRMGPPTCGTSTVSIGQTCMSVARAAGNMLGSISRLGLQRKPVVIYPRGSGNALAPTPPRLLARECASILQSAAPGTFHRIATPIRGRRPRRPTPRGLLLERSRGPRCLTVLGIPPLSSPATAALRPRLCYAHRVFTRSYRAATARKRSPGTHFPQIG